MLSYKVLNFWPSLGGHNFFYFTGSYFQSREDSSLDCLVIVIVMVMAIGIPKNQAQYCCLHFPKQKSNMLLWDLT